MTCLTVIKTNVATFMFPHYTTRKTGIVDGQRPSKKYIKNMLVKPFFDGQSRTM